ncbi:sugar transferase [Sanguibacter suarezii]|uniref:sugar transferase n=1 Tax=Sanguibacter suarezii TaxID=60921 RepID=UPI000AB73F39|nr:sugar transferase [Sanguibacter suarezii]
MTATEQVRRAVVDEQIGLAAGGSTPQERRFRPYILRIMVTDVIAVAVAVAVAYVLRFDTDGVARVSGAFAPSYLVVSVVLFAAWTAALFLGRTHDHRLIGSGPTEYQRVWQASWRLGAVVAVVAYMLRMEIGRGYLGVAFPLGLTLVFLGRYSWRQWLHRQRAAGRFQSRALVVGHLRKAALMVEELKEAPNTGFGVIGACIPAGEAVGGEAGGIEILGTMDDAASVALDYKADIVVVVGSDNMTTEALRRLGWDLEGTGVEIALTMAIRDVAGPRVTMQPVNGLPLVYVDEPRFAGPKYALKSVMDWILALVILVMISPMLVVIAVFVKVTSRGPVFYQQERVGVGSKPFKMIKFRSMVADAHSRLDEVLAAEGIESVGLFYKPKNDARVTKVGRVLRKYSLDELPQLLNVLRGEMSLVGPRPQIDQEVAQYDRTANRRLLVNPGLTGLWQVSGRSDLSAEEGIRMDVFYAENWTLFGDLLILARTAKAMIAGEGAY